MNAEIQRQMMVDGQIRTNEVSQPSLLEALYALPRETFVPAEFAAVAYSDREIPVGNGRILPMPMVTAKLIQAINLSPGETVLDIADATGYSAALLAMMGAKVTLLEESAPLCDQARANLQKLSLADIDCRSGSLVDGAGLNQTFDAILINGAVDEVPAQLLNLLKSDGRLIAVMGQGRAAKAVQFERSGAVFSARNLFDVAAPRLGAFQKKPEFVF